MEWLARGVLASVITPFGRDGSVDHELLRAHVDRLVDAGVNAIVAGADVGEFFSLARVERVGVLETVVNAVDGRVPVIGCTTSLQQNECIELSRWARDLGYGALLVSPPPYLRPSTDEVLDLYRRLGEVGLPIIVDNDPHRTGVDLDAQFLELAARNDAIVAVKESSGSLPRLHELRTTFQDRFATYCGTDTQAFEFLVWGAAGWIAPGANFLPELHLSLIEHCSPGGDLTAGRDLMRLLLPIARLLDANGKVVQYCKYGVTRRGVDVGEPRPPLGQLTSRERDQFDHLVRHLAGYSFR